MSSPTQSRINAIAATIVNMPAGLPAEYTGLSKADALALALSKSRFAIITPPEIQLVEYYYEGYNESQLPLRSPNVTERPKVSRPRSQQGLLPPPGLSNSNKRIRITLTVEIPVEDVFDRPPTPPAPRTSTIRRGVPITRSYHANELYGNGLYGWQMMGLPATPPQSERQSVSGVNLYDFDSLQEDY